jgi:hypothetical protein
LEIHRAYQTKNYVKENILDVTDCAFAPRHKGVRWGRIVNLHALLIRTLKGAVWSPSLARKVYCILHRRLIGQEPVWKLRQTQKSILLSEL